MADSYCVTVRGRDGMRQWEVDEWRALLLFGALAAEPETLEELAAALQRYLPEHRLLETGQSPAHLQAAVPNAGPWVLIDLMGRTAVSSGEFEFPDPRAGYRREKDAEGFSKVWMDTPADWLFQEADGSWHQTVERRAAAAASGSRLDARPVLFGRPLLEYLADGVLAALSQQPPLDEDSQHEHTRRIHAAWLMTARDDLQGRTPRQLLLADRERINSDLEHRADQWSEQDFAPPPLPVESSAYRFGGFGTAEVVLYFELVRALLEQAWQWVDDQPGMTREALVKRLEDYRECWLDSPSPENGDDFTPRELIELERRRTPATEDASQLAATSPFSLPRRAGKMSPTFIWFQTYQLEMEDEFAFSLIESHEQWEQENAGL